MAVESGYVGAGVTNIPNRNKTESHIEAAQLDWGRSQMSAISLTPPQDLRVWWEAFPVYAAEWVRGSWGFVTAPVFRKGVLVTVPASSLHISLMLG